MTRSFARVLSDPPPPPPQVLKTPSLSQSPSSVLPSLRAGEAEFTGWEGLVVGRALPADLDEREYLRILAGGSVWKRDHPDAIHPTSGAPIFVLSDAQARERDRLLALLFETVIEQHNVACTGGRSNLLNFIIGTTSYTGVTYFEVGTGAGTPASGDPALFTPYFRKQPSSYSVSGNQALVNTTFLAGEANTTYTESGVYGSSPTLTASTTLGSGVLFAHSTYAYQKTASISLGNNYYIYLN